MCLFSGPFAMLGCWACMSVPAVVVVCVCVWLVMHRCCIWVVYTDVKTTLHPLSLTKILQQEKTEHDNICSRQSYRGICVCRTMNGSTRGSSSIFIVNPAGIVFKICTNVYQNGGNKFFFIEYKWNINMFIELE